MVVNKFVSFSEQTYACKLAITGEIEGPGRLQNLQVTRSLHPQYHVNDSLSSCQVMSEHTGKLMISKARVLKIERGCFLGDIWLCIRMMLMSGFITPVFRCLGKAFICL
jgi:hypothetical protein